MHTLTAILTISTEGGTASRFRHGLRSKKQFINDVYREGRLDSGFYRENATDQDAAISCHESVAERIAFRTEAYGFYINKWYSDLEGYYIAIKPVHELLRGRQG